MPKPPKTELAYLAGIIDGEGSIGLTRSATKNAAGKSPYWTRFVSVSNTYEPVVRLFYRYFGGSFGTRKIYRAERKQTVVWETRNKRTTANVLTALLPYLKEKKAKARIVLRVVEGKLADVKGCRQIHKRYRSRGKCR